MIPAQSRTLYRYEIPVVGEPEPGYVAPPVIDGEAQKPAPLWPGPDLWDGRSPAFRSFAVAGLSGREEDECISAAGGSGTKLQALMAQRCLVEVDDRPVKRGEAEERTLWAIAPPMIRELWLSAYTAHNVAPRSALAAFRASLTTISR
jgi:hypothetical protein